MPRVDFVLAIKNAGLAVDDASMPSFANQLAGLLTEGTAKRDSRALAEAAQGLGGSIGAGADMDGLWVFANALTSKAPQMMALLAEVSRQPAFPEDEVKLAQANALQGLKAAEAQPGFRAERAIAEAIYGDHPYARTQPTEAGIAALSSDKLKAEHARRFRPDNALLVVTGRISEAEAVKLAKAHFGDWKASGDAPGAAFPARREATPAHTLLTREGSVQSAIRIGQPAIPATDPDFIALSMARTVLGGGFSSRLMQNLREDKGYTYGARASQRSYAGGGGLVSSADVRNEVTGASVKEFMDEFRRLGSEPVPADELDMNKRYVAGGYLINNQMQAAVASSLADNWLVGRPAEFLSEYVPLIQAVSAEQIMAMGKKYFDPAKQSVVVVGDPKAVAEQLTPFGEFKVQD
jgi:zinc protease